MINPTALKRGHYECRSLDDTVPVLTDLLAFEVVRQGEGQATVKHPNTDWELMVHEGAPEAVDKPHLHHYGVRVESLEEVNAAYFAGRCDVFTTDTSQLASIRSSLAPTPTDHVILPEVVSKEPLGPVVRHGDDEFFDIVKWVVFAVIEAEEKGITSENVESIRDTSTDPGIRRLLGVDPGMGENIGLSEDWAFNAIALVGNYGEIFDRNVGPDTPLRLERGINAQWTEGGLIYAPPIR